MRNKTAINFIKIKSSAVHTIYIGKIGKILTTDVTKNCNKIILGKRGSGSSGYSYVRKLNLYLF